MKKICVPSKYKMKAMAVFALVLIVFLVQLSGVNGCSCISTDPQTQYCNSEYAIRGNVTKLTYHTYGDGFMRGLLAERFYEVEISKVYKGNLNEENGGTVQIRTAGYDSLCGVGLQLNKEYLINGYFYEGQMRMNHCNMMFFSPVDGTNADFPRLSAQDCKCKIENTLGYVGVLLQRIRGQKPKMVCVEGNRVRCSSDSGSPGEMAECKYSSDTDDCDWDC